MEFTCRAACVQDAPLLNNIHTASWKNTYRGMLPQAYLDSLTDHWVEPFRSMLGQGVRARILEDGGWPVGCVSYSAAREEQMQGWGEIISLYLYPEQLHRGCGKALLREALADLREMGFQRCYLWVLRENDHARAFYERNGFVWSGEEQELEVAGVTVTDLRYTHHLPAAP